MGQAERTFSLLSSLSRDTGALRELLAPGIVHLLLGGEVAAKPQAQLIFSFAVNLMARLFPVIQKLHVILPLGIPLTAPVPRWLAPTIDQHIRELLTALGPPTECRISEGVQASPNCSLAVGSPEWNAEPCIFVGSDNWEATVSPVGPADITDAVNPVGAYAAACLGVGEVWKRLLYPYRARLPNTPVIPLSSPLSFSTYTYAARAGETNPVLPSSVEMSRLTIVGLGAGGGAAAFTLASLPELKGVLNQVEMDEVTDTNLNRYVFADAKDEGQPKIVVARQLFTKFSDLILNEFPCPYDEVVGKLTLEDQRFVLAAVHSREARRAIQYETPGTLWDAGATEQGDFFIWRRILGQTECMWCKYPQGEEDPEWQKALQLAQFFGLDAKTWLRKVRNNEAFHQHEVDAIVSYLGVNEVGFDLPRSGVRFGDWEADQCGRLFLPDLDEGVPVPFAPVMAGLLLAGEVIKEQNYQDVVLDSYYWNTLVGNFMRGNKPHRKPPRNDCQFCHDQAYLAQYDRRWGAHDPGGKG